MVSKESILRRIKRKSGCWEWQGIILSNGYGRINFHGKPMNAHRVSFHLWTGFDLDSTAFICHICANKRCVNPKHLYAGDPRSNAFDAIVAGDWVNNNGELSGLAKLTNEQADEIRAKVRSGVVQKSLAKELGVHANTIWRIVNNKTYRQVK